MKRIILLALLLPMLAFAQAVRVDVPLQTSGPNVPTSGGPLPQALWVANATVALCTHTVPPLTFAACVAAPITTYTDSTLTVACPSTSPMVQLPGNTCTKTAGAAGNLGLWYAQGLLVDYYVTSTYGTFGPYTITQGSGSGGAGNPAPPAFAAQFANSLVNQFQGDSTILINPTAHSFKAPINSGFSYATGFGNGTTTGISSCAAVGHNQTCVSDPSYGTTETYPFNSGTTGPYVPVQFRWNDDRSGIRTRFFKDWPVSANTSSYTANNMGDGNIPADMINCQWATIGLTTGVGQKNVTCVDEWMTNTTPGWNIGNAAVGPGQWKVNAMRRMTFQDYGQGIREVQNESLNCNGTGDCITHYFTTNGHNGFVDRSGEATKGFGNNVNENGTAFAGTCSTGCTTGTTSMVISPTAGSGTQGTGRYIFIPASPTASGSITALAAGTFTSTEKATLSVSTGSLSASNAWGTLASNVATPTLNQPPWTTSETFNVTITSGTFDNTHLMCFGGQFHEQAIPTSVGSVSGGVQSITVLLRFPHNSGSPLMQGGPCGGLELPNYWSIGSQHYLADVLGSVDGSTIEVTFFQNATATPSPGNIGFWNGSLYSIYNMTSLSNSGTTVSFTYNASGSTLGSKEYGSIWITGASDAAFNNNVCSNVVWATTTTATCTIAGLGGSHTSATAVAQIAGPGPTAIGPLNAFNLFQIAEVWDVQNETTTPPQVDGTIALEPNVMPITGGTAINEPNHISQKITMQTDVITSFDNAGVFNGMVIEGVGQGVVGGGSVTSNCFICLINLNGDFNYLGTGGYQLAPNLMNIQGGYANGFVMSEGPTNAGNSGNVVSVVPTLTQQNDPNYRYGIFNATNAGGGTNSTFMLVAPATGATSFGTNGVMNIQGAGGINLLASGQTISANTVFSGSTAILSGAPSASQSALLLNGFTYKAGTGTTNYPSLYVWSSGATAPTTFDAGTLIGGNCDSTVADALAFYKNGSASTFKVTCAGAASANVYLTSGEFAIGTCSTAATVNPANGNRQNLTLTNGATCALTFTQPATGTASITLKIIQSSVSTFNGAISGCKWPGGAVPTITQTSAAVDFIGVYLDGTSAFCTISQNFQ